MLSSHRSFLFSLALLLALLVGAVLPSAAYADDGTPPAEPPAESSEPVEVPQSLPEMLDQLPEETGVVVVDENNQPVALAAEEAAQIILNSDPVWCPTGLTPGGLGCTPNQASVTALIAYIQTNSITGDGTIYFQDGVYAGAETAITFDHDDVALAGLGALGLEGGWDLGANTKVLNGATTFSVPFSVSNWVGDVSLTDINVTASDSFAALVVNTTGNISVDDTNADGNTTGSGAYLDSCQYDGVTGLCTGTGGISVTDSTFDNNYFNGLVTDSAAATSLDNVTANFNGLNGVQITNFDDDGTGDVTVSNSTFSTNSNGSGLDILADGSITLTSILADYSNYGLLLDAAGDITINGGSLHYNAFDGVLAWSGGDISFIGGIVQNNAGTGAYLDASYGSGNVSLAGINFTGNGDMGLLALADDGDITLNNVNIDGNDVTGLGAWLKTFGGGDIYVWNSSFTENMYDGLLVVSSGGVELTNVTASDNGYDGADVYSLYTWACFGNNNIIVDVFNGTFENNGSIGLYVAPGSGGTVNFTGTQTFTNNGEADYVLDLEDPDCSEHKDDEEQEDNKEYNVVEVPFTGGDPVGQDCELFAGNILQLPDGTFVQFDCPFDGSTTLQGLNEEDLPGTLGAGADFVAALMTGLIDPDNVVITFNPDGSITVTFLLPEGSNARGYDILFWDPAANGGAGGWVTLPQSRFGEGVTKLNPDDPSDGRLVKSGVRRDGDKVSVTVNFTGVFVLVSR